MERAMKDLDDSSTDSLGSEEEENEGTVGDQQVGSDSLLDSSGDSADSDGSQEEMDVDEDALNEQLNQINDTLAANPYSYDSYVEKIKILQKMGDLGKLRETREKFSGLYPLSESIWLDWIRDEIKMACEEEEKDEVVQLFDRAVTDYLSVDIWLEYLKFCLSQIGEENGVEKCREAFEKALGSCGLHVAMGSLVWDTYRDFEVTLVGTPGTEEQVQAQENRFITLCRRQLSVPLLGMRNTFENVKSKIDVDENTSSAYKKALDRLDSLETWEGKLVQSTGEDRIQVYKNYIEEEKKLKSNPARIQCLYERAVADNPLNSSLWLEYLEYLSKYLKIDSIIFGTANRACRNCSWDISVWLKHMYLIESFCDAQNVFETMKAVFEKAVAYCATGEDAGTVWLKYLEFLRRKLDINNPSEKELVILRKTYVAAEQHLLQLLTEPNDYISEILVFRARLETQLAKGITQDVNKFWKDIMSRGYNQHSKIWLQYILQEVTYGAETRKIRMHYSKAVGLVKDDLQTISNLWINFERDNGDLSTLQQCETKISKELARQISEMATVPIAPEPLPTVKDYTTTNFVPPKGNKRKINNNDAVIPSKRGRKIEDTVDSVNNSASVFKVPFAPGAKSDLENSNAKDSSRGVVVKHDPSKDNRTVFLSNLKFTTEEDEIKNFFKGIGEIEEVRLVRDFKGRSKGFGYVFFTKNEMIKKALEKDRELIDNRPVFVSRCDPDKSTRQKQFKYNTTLERNKLFVKGLPFSLTADGLRDLFKVHGDIKDCRLVTYRNGHSKGLAYVEYIDEACASQAILKTDGTVIEGNEISVAISNPPAKDQSNSNSTVFQRSSTSDKFQRRTPKAFVPRSVQMSGTKVKTEPSNNDSKSAPKSNQDFRSMFLK